MNYNFEWDTNKARTNLSKHKISFESATSVFRDKNAISISDEEHSEYEEHWLTIEMNKIEPIHAGEILLIILKN